MLAKGRVSAISSCVTWHGRASWLTWSASREHDEGAVFGGNPEDSDAYRRYAALQDNSIATIQNSQPDPRVVVLTKTDLAYDEDVERARAYFEERTGREVFTISAPTGEGLAELKRALHLMILEAEAAEERSAVLSCLLVGCSSGDETEAPGDDRVRQSRNHL